MNYINSCSTKVLILFILAFNASSAFAATVLIYHHVSKTMPASTSISPEDFIAHLNYLSEHNYKVVPLTDLAEKIQRNENLPDKTVAITFDDSYADVYTAAYPLLKARGWPFTFFVNTDSVSSGKLFVTWDQLREMSRNGVTIANHTSRHDHIVRLSANETESDWRIRMTKDIENAQQKIKMEIGSAPKIFAYPFGEYDAKTQALLKSLDYIAFTQQAGVLNLQTAQQILPRFPFGGSFTKLDDFAEKIQTLSMPLKKVSLYSNEKNALNDIVIREGDKPYLVLEPSDPNLLKQVNCYSSNEGKIPTQIINQQIWAQETQTLKSGRTKINCTAPSKERGRYYWFTQLWLVTDKNGKWNYSD